VCVCAIKGAFEIWSIVRVINVMIGGVCVRTKPHSFSEILGEYCV